MSVERAPGGTSLIDVLDRVLDKGIVIDAWVRISPVGIDLITVEARVVVASHRHVLEIRGGRGHYLARFPAATASDLSSGITRYSREISREIDRHVLAYS